MPQATHGLKPDYKYVLKRPYLKKSETDADKIARHQIRLEQHERQIDKTIWQLAEEETQRILDKECTTNGHAEGLYSTEYTRFSDEDKVAILTRLRNTRNFETLDSTPLYAYETKPDIRLRITEEIVRSAVRRGFKQFSADVTSDYSERPDWDAKKRVDIFFETPFHPSTDESSIAFYQGFYQSKGSWQRSPATKELLPHITPQGGLVCHLSAAKAVSEHPHLTIEEAVKVSAPILIDLKHYFRCHAQWRDAKHAYADNAITEEALNQQAEIIYNMIKGRNGISVLHKEGREAITRIEYDHIGPYWRWQTLKDSLRSSARMCAYDTLAQNPEITWGALRQDVYAAYKDELTALHMLPGKVRITHKQENREDGKWYSKQRKGKLETDTKEQYRARVDETWHPRYDRAYAHYHEGAIAPTAVYSYALPDDAESHNVYGKEAFESIDRYFIEHRNDCTAPYFNR